MALLWLLFSKPEYWSFVSTESKNSNNDKSYWCSNENGIETQLVDRSTKTRTHIQSNKSIQATFVQSSPAASSILVYYLSILLCVCCTHMI